MAFFNLLKGEKIVKEIKPEKGLLWQMIFTGIIGGGVMGLFFGGFFLAALLGKAGIAGLFLLFPFVLLFLLIFIVLPIIASFLRYDKLYYWITNKRVLVKRGLIGYRVNSIPFERISDIILSRSFIENIFGISSLHIQSLAGQFTQTGRLGAEGSLRGILTPEETQGLIFKLIEEKRKRENLTM